MQNEDERISFCIHHSSFCIKQKKKPSAVAGEGFLLFRDLSWSQGPKRKGDCLKALTGDSRASRGATRSACQRSYFFLEVFLVVFFVAFLAAFFAIILSHLLSFIYNNKCC